MKRRQFVACGVLSVAIAGCLEDTDNRTDDDASGTDTLENTTDDASSVDDSMEPTVNNNETVGDNNTGTAHRDEEISPQYRIIVLPPEGDIDTDDVCVFADVPNGAQFELEQAITDADFENDGRGTFESDEPPELLETDCYAQYIEFDGQYYWTEIEVASG